MKHFRLSTLILLVIIVVLSLNLAIQHMKASQREARLKAALNEEHFLRVQAESDANLRAYAKQLELNKAVTAAGKK